MIGERGDKGETGDKGLTGDQGLTGNTGLTGDTGDTGTEGSTGQRGARGTSGRVAAAFTTLAVVNVFALGWTAQQSNRIEANTASALDQFCTLAQARRSTLEQQDRNTTRYLVSAAGMRRTDLNNFTRRISAPQLKVRLQVEQLPARCKR